MFYPWLLINLGILTTTTTESDNDSINNSINLPSGTGQSEISGASIWATVFSLVRIHLTVCLFMWTHGRLH